MNLEEDDIYEHVTSPKEVYLCRVNRNEHKIIAAMASFNKRDFCEIPCLIVEGIAVHKEYQGRGIFSDMARNVIGDEQVICLRTQNPRMYRALEKLCKRVYPNYEETPELIKSIRRDFAGYLGEDCDENGIVMKHYGGLFYGIEPRHERVSKLFEHLGVKVLEGDGLLVIGER